ncbi:MAG: hypothetical protein R3C11_10130 [Planctomycetaceae bacterium]
MRIYSNRQRNIMVGLGVAAPRWMMDVVGSHTFIANNLIYPRTIQVRTDAYLEELAAGMDLSTLSSLNVESGSIQYSWRDTKPVFIQSSFTGRSMGLLRDCTRMEQFNANGSLLQDDAMSTVGNWPNLTELELAGTQVTDKGLRELKDLPQLEIMNLARLTLSDEVMPILFEGERYQEMYSLNLAYTRISPQSLRELDSHPKLFDLSLAGLDLRQATTADWKPLAEQSRLYVL